MLITFDSFNGLAPTDGERTKSATRAARCLNASLRKGDIRPLREPQETTRVVAPNMPVLLENDNTGTVVSALSGDGVVVDQFRAGSLVYAVLDGGALLLEGDTVVGPYFPARPTAAPIIDVTLAPMPEEYSIGTVLDAISAVDTPVNNTGNSDPNMINLHRTTQASAAEFAPETVMQAMDWVLNNYKIKLQPTNDSTWDADHQYTFAQALDEIVSITDTKPNIVRVWDNTGDALNLSKDVPYDQYKPAVNDALTGIITALGNATFKELTGGWNGFNFAPVVPKTLTSPASTGVYWSLDTVLQGDIVDVPSGNTYNPGSGVILTLGSGSTFGMTSVAQYVASSWRLNTDDYSADGGVQAVRNVYDLAFAECAAARSDPMGYKWFGLYGSTFDNTGKLDPFEVGVDTLHPGGEKYSAPVPRAYCYTWIDIWGRESQPSEPTLVSGQNDLGPAALHTVVCPDTAPAEVGLVAVYRMSVPHEAADADALNGQWVRVAATPVANGYAGVALTDVGDAGYAVLNTVINERHPDVPKFLGQTESGHSVCTGTGGDTVFISKRHTHWAFPFNRRYNLPVGLLVQNMKVVGNSVYIVTRDYPIVLNVGEDKGDDGLQVEVHMLTHARYGCLPQSLVSTGWGVMVWSSVGLLAIAGVNVTVASITLVDDDQVSLYHADACAVYHQGMYFGFRTDGKVVLFDVPDPTFGETVRAPMTMAEVAAVAVCTNQQGDLLLLPPDTDKLHQWDWTSGTFMTLDYQTYYQKLPSDMVFTAVKVHGVGVVGTLECYDADGLRWSRNVLGDRPHRCPATRLRAAVSLRFTGSATYISNIEVATGMGDLGTV